MVETQTTTKPLPCPFCGAENVTIEEGSTYRWAHASCAECGAAAGDIRRQYGQGTDNPEVQTAAIAEWNTRDRREIDAKDKRIAELEHLATLSPIKVGDISITLGLTETGEARMTFDGADDATLAVVAGKFALAMQATMDGAK